MLENGLINRYQLWLLIVNFILNSSILIIPGPLVSVAKQDAWISMILATILGSFIIYNLLLLNSRYPKKTIVNIGEILLGKPVGKVIGFMYAWFFLHLSALVLRDIGDFITTVIMPGTPMIVLIILVGVLVYLTVYYGLEVISRSNELFTPYAVFGFWLTIFFVIPLMDIDHIKPILDGGIKPIIDASYSVLGFPYAELVVFLMILPFVGNRKHIKKVFLSAGIVGGFSLTITVLSSILVLNIRPTELSVYATFNMARLINIGDFLTRVEVITALAYIIVIFTKIVVSFYGGLLAISQVFNVADYKPLLLPVLIIVITLSILLNENIVEVVNVAEQTWTSYSLFFGFILPLIYLGISKLKKN